MVISKQAAVAIAASDLPANPVESDNSASKTSSAPLTEAQCARADQVIAALARLWPRCFQIYGRRRRPLVIGIDKMLIEQMAPAIAAGRISEADIRAALRRYSGQHGYLPHCAIAGNPRIGLNGLPAGAAVTEQQAERARRILKKRKATRQLSAQASPGHDGGTDSRDIATTGGVR